MPRILKFGKNIGYDKLYCVLKNQPHMAYQSLYLSIFLSFQKYFSSKFSQQLLDLGFRNLVQTSGMISCIVYKRISLILLISTFICPFFFISNTFSIISAQHL